MIEHEVVIAGGGPTGLMLAAELAIAGVDVAIVERRTSQDLAGARAGGLHARTIEVLDQRGVADRFLSAGKIMQVAGFNMTPLDISDFPTRHNYGLALTQNHIERILGEWVGELPVTMYRAREVIGFAQDDSGVRTEVSDGQALRARYLVGCDGGRSIVRKTAGIEFPGWDATTSWLLAEAQVSGDTKWGLHEDAFSTHAIARMEDGTARMALTERQPGATSEPTLDDVRALLVDIYGTDFGIHSPTWISRFTDMTRQAAAYRDRRVLLAGDAAHVHPPLGGQGLNIGVQDAVNLGWKLALVVQQQSPERLLDTYHAERHPVAARVLRNTMAQVALRPLDARTKALKETIAEWLRLDETRRHVAAEMSGLGVHYDLGAGHSLVGRRMPDRDLVTAAGPARLFTLLHKARPVLLNLGEPDALGASAWGGRVQLVDARSDGPWELPAIGTVPAPDAVLVRPDGYVAWVGDGTPVGLTEAMTTWFGPEPPA